MYVHVFNVRNSLRNFNRKHSSRNTIHIPRKHRSKKLYINDLQRAENTAMSSHPPYVRYRIFILLFLFHSRYSARSVFSVHFIAHYIGGAEVHVSAITARNFFLFDKNLSGNEIFRSNLKRICL